MTSSRKRAARALVVLAAAAALAAGCGGDDDDAAEASDVTEATTTETTVAEESGDTITVTAIDYAFEGLPDDVASGAKLTLHNDSDAELHEMVIFRLPDDETRSAVELSQLPEDELGALFAGEPAAVLLAPPGEDSFPAVGDGTLTEPGRYVVFCAIPEGADPDAYLNAPPSDGPPDVAGGPPHFVLGMVGEITVE